MICVRFPLFPLLQFDFQPYTVSTLVSVSPKIKIDKSFQDYIVSFFLLILMSLSLYKLSLSNFYYQNDIYFHRYSPIVYITRINILRFDNITKIFSAFLQISAKRKKNRVTTLVTENREDQAKDKQISASRVIVNG